MPSARPARPGGPGPGGPGPGGQVPGAPSCADCAGGTPPGSVPQRLLAFADGAIPFGDPFRAYYAGCWECAFSRGIGEDTRDLMALTAFSTVAIVPGHIGRAAGPLKAWVRVKASHSRTYGIGTYLSLTLGSNQHFRDQIGSPLLRCLNAGIRGLSSRGRGGGPVCWSRRRDVG